MFIYKRLDKSLHTELMAKGYRYLWFDGYMNYAPTDTGERLDIRRIVPLKELSPEMQEARELAHMLHQSQWQDGMDVLTEALTQDELYPIEYFNDRLDPAQLPDHRPGDHPLFALQDDNDWFVEVEVEAGGRGELMDSGGQTALSGL